MGGLPRDEQCQESGESDKRTSDERRVEHRLVWRQVALPDRIPQEDHDGEDAEDGSERHVDAIERGDHDREGPVFSRPQVEAGKQVENGRYDHPQGRCEVEPLEEADDFRRRHGGRGLM